MVTVEYVVAGPMLILIGLTQIWIKRGAARDEARRTAGTPAQEDTHASPKPPLWDAWTRILGYVAVAMGAVVLVMGLLGK